MNVLDRIHSQLQYKESGTFTCDSCSSCRVNYIHGETIYHCEEIALILKYEDGEYDIAELSEVNPDFGCKKWKHWLERNR